MFNLLEALNDKQKEVVKDLAGDYDETKSHPELFRQYGAEHSHRIIIPFTNDIIPTPDHHIQKHLLKHGWFVSDYGKGHAVKYFTDQKGNKRKTIKSIGKILQETKGDTILHPDRLSRLVKGVDGKPIRDENGRMVSEIYQPTLLQYFNTDPKRDASKNRYQIIISRHRDDIGGMTSGRCWEDDSCMRLPHSSAGTLAGSNYKKIAADFKHHSLVAYLTKVGDDDIEAPLARVTVKKYANTHGEPDIYRVGSSVYGNSPTEFSRRVNAIVAAHYPMQTDAEYKLPTNLWADIHQPEKYNALEGLNIEEDGLTTHYHNGELHDYLDENGIKQPAVKSLTYHIHYKNGVEHNEEGQPSHKSEIMTRYMVNGVLHNPNGAALISHRNGVTEIEKRLHGILHTDNDVPSKSLDVEYGREEKRWHRHGELHREDGKPAVVMSAFGEKKEHYYKNGIPFRENGLPHQIITKDGVITEECWLDENNNYHREGDLPAVIKRKPDGSLLEESYYTHGLPDREKGKPANRYHIGNTIFDTYYEKGVQVPTPKGVKNQEIGRGGKILTKLFNDNGQLHTDTDEPSLTVHSPQGKLLMKQWHTNGEVNRDNDLPATITYNPNGTIESEEWMKNGEKYRDSDKPQRIEYDEYGNVTQEDYENSTKRLEDSPRFKRYEIGRQIHLHNNGVKKTLYQDGSIETQTRSTVRTDLPNGFYDVGLLNIPNMLITKNKRKGLIVSDKLKELISNFDKDPTQGKRILSTLKSAMSNQEWDEFSQKFNIRPDMLS